MPEPLDQTGKRHRRGVRVREMPWFAAIVAISALLFLVTLLSYAIRGPALLSGALFWLGLSDQNNIGDWWSSMLAALAAVMAFDGYFDLYKPRVERRGWCAIGFALLMLSFAEVASVHEYLDRRNDGSLVLLGVVGLAVVGYGMAQLHRTAIAARTFTSLLLGFALLALVPLLEELHVSPGHPVLYGVRTALEEGIEIIALLVFIGAVRRNSEYLFRVSKGLFAAPVRRRQWITTASLVLWPILTGATFLLPSSGGPANWLTAVLLVLCALLAVRTAVASGTLTLQSQLVIAFYLGASAVGNAVRLEWDFVVLGTPVSARGIAFTLIILAAVAILPSNGRRLSAPHALLVATATAASAIAWPTSQLLWCGLPPLFGLWLYSIESNAGAVQHAPTPSDVASTPGTASAPVLEPLASRDEHPP